MDSLFGMLPLLIPVLIMDIALAAAAVVHILRHPHYRFGNKAVWLVIAIVLLLFGPIIYFAFGKGKKNERTYDTEPVEKFWEAKDYK